ncbi:hypothetical protein B0H16DRAFT_103707, partial [Mycena metata]
TAGHTDDSHQALVYISQTYPRASLLGLGFSLGAGILIGDLAEKDLPVVSSRTAPWHVPESTLFTRNVCARGMSTNWRNLLKRNEKALRMFPNHPFVCALPFGRPVDTPRSRNSTKHSPDASADPRRYSNSLMWTRLFYRWTSSDAVLKDVGTPLLTITSTDDPLVRAIPSDTGGNPYVVMARSKVGGHLGWFKKGRPMGDAPSTSIGFLSSGFGRPRTLRTWSTVGESSHGYIDGAEFWKR